MTIDEMKLFVAEQVYNDPTLGPEFRALILKKFPQARPKTFSELPRFVPTIGSDN